MSGSAEWQEPERVGGRRNSGVDPKSPIASDIEPEPRGVVDRLRGAVGLGSGGQHHEGGTPEHEEVRGRVPLLNASDRDTAQGEPGQSSVPAPYEVPPYEVPPYEVPEPDPLGPPTADRSPVEESPPEPAREPDLVPEPEPAPVQYSEPVSASPPVDLTPRHIGPRPPLYSAHPLGKPSLGDDAFAAFSPDIVVDGITLGGLAVRGASVRGDSHRHEGTCRQDAMAVTRIGGPGREMLALAVADGVGSSRFSHIASASTLHEVIDCFHDNADAVHEALLGHDEATFETLANDLLADSVTNLRRNWARADPAPYSDRDYATTLHVLLVPTDASVRVRGLVGVGDGGLLRLASGVWVTPGGTPDGTEALLETSTAALPVAYDHARTTIIRTEPGELLLLGTDGMTNLVAQGEFGDCLAGWWGGGNVPELTTFLWQMQLRARSYDDDRTAICLWDGTPLP